MEVDGGRCGGRWSDFVEVDGVELWDFPGQRELPGSDQVAEDTSAAV